MKKSLFFLLVAISTFFLGFLCAGKPAAFVSSAPLVSLEEISKNSEYFDGKRVEIITYAHLCELSELNLVIGEPYEKEESFTYLDLKENSIDLNSLQAQLSENFSRNHYKRVKVKVIGKVYDNCNKGIPCCFGNTLKIITEDVRPMGQIEEYTVPPKFQFNESESSPE